MTETIPSPSTGLAGLDAVLHGLLPGDNVVLRVDGIDDYLPFVNPYWQRALETHRKLIYFRFARHRRLLPDRDEIQTVTVHPEIGFERFLNEIIDTIEHAGTGAYYVFDCLSELAVDWYSDRMLANFFMITCPFLYELDTIAYFALLKHSHSVHATEGIHRTAQVIMDVHRNREQLFIQPLKADRRYSSTMFLVHSWEGTDFQPVTSSAILSEIFAGVPHPWLDFTINRPGVWSRAFMDAQETLQAVETGQRPPEDAEQVARRLIGMALTREKRLGELAERYFDLASLIQILKRMIGTGLMGGKSLGMLLARAILGNHNRRWLERLEAHDSFYVGSDLFYTYIVQNGCWWLRRRDKQEGLDDYLERADRARAKMMTGTFPDYIKSQFLEMLDYFGQSPIIVRSSSLLEDNYGNAFSGKYESVFCTNQGSPDDRLQAFIEAVRTVYASTMSREALSYRAHRGLLDQDEQMALLVQRVSGSAYGDHFFPHCSGVGYSFNAFAWDRDIDPEAGMLRLVFGLGTRAVDRTEDDYTRLVALNAPEKQPYDSEDSQRYVQRHIDLLDLGANAQTSCAFERIDLDAIGEQLNIFASRDRQLEERARRHGMSNVFSWILDFQELIRNTPFIGEMRDMLRILKNAYNYDVDIEFTANFIGDREFLINLVQCRPFQVKVRGRTEGGSLTGELPAVVNLLKSSGPVIGQSSITNIDHLIYIVPSAYSALPQNERYAVARLLGRLTRAIDDHEGTTMLIGPGRWGTSTPSLGVPVSFNEIKTVSAICEVALMHEGLIPDISLGTHFFNDLVELDMLFMAVSPGKEGHWLNQEYFTETVNQLTTWLPEDSRFADVVKVVDTASLDSEQCLQLKLDSIRQTAACYIARDSRA